MPPFQNLEDRVFGRLTVKFLYQIDSNRKYRWWCDCACGGHKIAASASLKNGHTKSCGCWQREAAREKHIKRPYESTYNLLKSVALKQHIALDLTYIDFLSFVSVPRCHYCRRLIRWVAHNRNHHLGGTGYNLDRKDSNKGYTNDNCVVCCGRCNRGKCDLFTYDEWRAMTAIFRNGELCPSN